VVIFKDMQKQNAIEVSNLTKKFGDIIAVDNVSFTVKEGEFFGFLGPNGAGKTTLIRMLLNLQVAGQSYHAAMYLRNLQR